MSPASLAYLQRAERMTQRDAAFSRRWYRRTGMTAAQICYYGARRSWPDALRLVQLNGIGPYS